MRLLKEHYKTYEGARKRAAFENGLASGEFKRGDKARLYRYLVVADGSVIIDGHASVVWRVAREEH